MKRLIKWILNHLPRTFMQRVAGWAVPLVGLLYVGRGRRCPICGTSRRHFLPYGYTEPREEALCPSCLSLERHRMLWLFLKQSGLPMKGRMLHIAPEVCLKKRLRREMIAGGGEYLTADLESPLADLHFDVQQIPLDDEYASIIICNHLMEHVADERKALEELYRVMRRGGWGVMLSLVDLERDKTFEDDSITDPDERTRIFGQYDHRRIYGCDYADRLRRAGFEVEDIDFVGQLSTAERQEMALFVNRDNSLRRADHIYLVRKA